MKKKIKPLAIYLPQFHSIPENDEWWGKDFTEWVNMKKAEALFDGHYQPRIPLDKDYYDLTDPKVMERQTKLAKEKGIYGFCVYHYWFNGHKLLEKPMEQYLKNENIDFPFCFSWANEHWTNAWVSGENKILIEQNFDNRDDWVDHFNYLLPFFKDKRYIKEENKPIFLIYYPSIIMPLKEFMEKWQDLAKENGFEGIKFVYQHHLYYLQNSESEKLFDYGIEFEPQLSFFETKNIFTSFGERMRAKISYFLQTKLKVYIKLRKTKPTFFNYDQVWEKSLSRKPKNNRMIPTAFVDWDNTPRRGVRGSLFIGATPHKFKKYFSRLIDKIETEYETEYVFLFAWNEWAEGGYLEPDEKYGYEYLNAIQEVLKER